MKEKLNEAKMQEQISELWAQRAALISACQEAEKYYLPTPVLIQLRNALLLAGVKQEEMA